MKKLNLKSTFLFFSLIVFLSCSSNDDSAEEVQKEEEEKEVTFDGDYRGTWNSSTDKNIVYTDFGISAKFTFTNTTKTKLRGDFFATPIFNSCCDSGGNDGTMSFNLENDKISTFTFNSTVAECGGNFIGSGSITSQTPYTIEIDFTGEDCDGVHEGQMVFKRINN